MLSDRDRKILELIIANANSAEIQEKLKVTPGVIAGVRHRSLRAYLAQKGLEHTVGKYTRGPGKNSKTNAVADDTGTTQELVTEAEAEEQHVDNKPKARTSDSRSHHHSISTRGFSSSSVTERIKAREEASIFRPKIREGMTAAEIMEEYDRFKVKSKKTPKTKLNHQASSESGDEHNERETEE